MSCRGPDLLSLTVIDGCVLCFYKMTEMLGVFFFIISISHCSASTGRIRGLAGTQVHPDII